MKFRVLLLTLLAAGTVFAQISVGIRIGAPPRPRVMMVQPQNPGDGYVWVGGYWYPVGHRYTWHDGYWTRPAYEGSRWVQPHYDGQSYYSGYWDGDRGQFGHNHKWDKNRDHKRDFERDNDNDNERGHGHGHDKDKDRR